MRHSRICSEAPGEPERRSRPTSITGDGKLRFYLGFTSDAIQRKLVTRDDQSSLTITVDGVDFIEQNHNANVKRRLTGAS